MTFTLANLPVARSWAQRASFAIIILVFLMINVVAIFEALHLRTRDRQVVDSMLTSIELVANLSRDVDHMRLLADAHILEPQPALMASLERRIAVVQRDYEATARAYESSAMLPAERDTWEVVKADVRDLERPLQAALALSRRNHDAEARAVMASLEVRFDALEEKLEALRTTNRQGAERLMAQTRAAGRAWLTFLGIATLLGVVLTAAMGVASERLQSRRDAELKRRLVLEEQNRGLDAFAGRVAHDLRGPLTTIGLAASKLSRHASPDEERTGALLQRGVERLEALINDLLALARVEAIPKDAACDPATVAASVREDLEAQVADAGAEMRVAVEPAKVHCGEGLLRQVLWNVTENALKYRRPGVHPELEIRGTAVDGAYDVRVSDNGVGMTSEEARRAFDPFYRALRSQDIAGTGLGLAIVKRIVEACGGTVSIASEIDRGTTLLIHLPLAG